MAATSPSCLPTTRRWSPSSAMAAKIPVSAEPGLVKRYSTPASLSVCRRSIPPVPVIVLRMGDLAVMRGPSCRGGELALQCIHLPQIASDIVVAAPLAGRQPEPAPCIGVPCPRAAQMDQGGQVLLLPQRRRGEAVAGQRARHLTIQQRGGELDGVARHHAGVEAGLN